MAFTHVESNKLQHSSGTSRTWSAALAAGAAGDVVVFAAIGRWDAAVTAADITGESAFTMLAKTANSVYSCEMGHLVLASGGAKEINVTWDSSFTGGLLVMQFTADNSIELDASNEATGVGTNPSVSITTTVDNALVVMGLETSAPGSPTADAGWTGYTGGAWWGVSAMCYDVDVETAGVKTPSFTTSSGTWAGQALAFKEVAGGGGGGGGGNAYRALRRRRR